MSKEKKEVKEEIKPVAEKKQKYALSDIVLNQGYTAMIPRHTGRLFKIGFDINLQGHKMNAYASVMEQVENPGRGGGVLWKWTGQTYLEDLTDEQLRLLTIARVIILNKEQEKIYKEKFFSS